MYNAHIDSYLGADPDVKFIIPMVVPNRDPAIDAEFVMDIRAVDDIDKSFEDWRKEWDYDFLPVAAARLNVFDFEIAARMQTPGRIPLEQAAVFTRNFPTQFDAHNAYFFQLSSLNEAVSAKMFFAYYDARVAVAASHPLPPKPPRETVMMFEMRQQALYEERRMQAAFEWSIEHEEIA